MAGPVRDRAAMIRAMAPVLRPGRFVFASLPDRAAAARAAPAALSSFAEDEGVSVILPVAEAAALGLDTSLPMACVTLSVHSALQGVGLTAAVAGALARRGIACNVVAAFHHDHLFVPAERADEAMAALRALAASGGTGEPDAVDG